MSSLSWMTVVLVPSRPCLPDVGCRARTRTDPPLAVRVAEEAVEFFENDLLDIFDRRRSVQSRQDRLSFRLVLVRVRVEIQAHRIVFEKNHRDLVEQARVLLAQS